MAGEEKSFEYKVDPDRVRRFEGLDGTGIYIRVKNDDGKWGNADILLLDEESLDHWLRSRDSIEWPINVVKVLLDHPNTEGQR